MKSIIYDQGALCFIALLLSGASCSPVAEHQPIDLVYEALKDQNEYFYEVEFQIYEPYHDDKVAISGIVALNRNENSGISSSYFRKRKGPYSNYFQTIFSNNRWIDQLSSNSFQLDQADLLIDSLHSPIVINPKVLFQLHNQASSVNYQKLNPERSKWIFEFEEVRERMVLVWDHTTNFISDLEYAYQLQSEDIYIRKWSFTPLKESEFSSRAAEYRVETLKAEQFL